MPKIRNQRLNGQFPLSYLGVNPVTPLNFVFEPRAPTINDYAGFYIGDIWLDISSLPTPPTGEDIYMLVDKAGGIATWVNMGGRDVLTMTGDTGGPVAPNTSGNINVPGAHGINTAGNPGTSTMTFAINNAITLGDLANIPANNNALTIATGDIELQATNNVGNIKMTGYNSTGTKGIIFSGPFRFVTSDANSNQFIGFNAGNLSTTGVNNIIYGSGSLVNVTTGNGNCVIGNQCLVSTTTGTDNTALGSAGLQFLTTGTNNLSMGAAALNRITTGRFNTGVGVNTGFAPGANAGLTTGEFNLLMGYLSGQNYRTSESSNILLNNEGVITESNTMRVGVSTGSGERQLNRVFIQGISGVTTGGAAVAVLIDAAGQLGTISSSIRYKENIKNMDCESDAILQLNPVTFFYKSQQQKTLQYGLIAEEVETLFPGLVVYDKEGLPTSVKYHDLPVLLLNELKKLYARVDELEKRFSSQDHYD